MELRIRPYTPEDCETLARLFYDTVHTVNAADYTPEQLNAWATGTVDLAAWNTSFLAHHTVVAELEGIIVGFGDMDGGYLDRLYVHRDYQRRGIATAICNALEGCSSSRRFTTHASITARPFFEQRGYRVQKEQQVERFGVWLTNFVMEKNVSNQYDNPAFFAEYAKMSRSQYGLEGAGEWHQMESLFPELTGKGVLDLGCGYGWHCKYAADRGAASVLGIDQSSLMIEEAQRRNAHERIEYRVCGIRDYDYPADAYDLVVSNLVLHYIEDLDEVYRLVHRTLKPGGMFLFNIEHPTFTAGVNQQFSADGTWPVTDYYYPGQRTTDFLGHEVKKYHHTLTQILSGLLKCGFAIEAVEEAMPPLEWRDQMPEEMKRPMMLLVRARKH